ncbi:hypothetical protein HZ326_5105 [Fusarium oxysporum f. sp. albedinis]|nr:hypothetical protein HZ326_5105 [Fusarium oxysporum f. sp. albedinis]
MQGSVYSNPHWAENIACTTSIKLVSACASLKFQIQCSNVALEFNGQRQRRFWRSHKECISFCDKRSDLLPDRSGEVSNLLNYRAEDHVLTLDW